MRLLVFIYAIKAVVAQTETTTPELGLNNTRLQDQLNAYSDAKLKEDEYTIHPIFYGLIGVVFIVALQICRKMACRRSVQA